MKSNCGGTAFKGNILSKTLQNKPRANTNSDQAAVRHSVAFCDKYFQAKECFCESCNITSANIA